MMTQMITASKTPRAITVIGYCLLVIVLASCSGDGSQMRQQLEELERQNRADSVMTNDSLAELLVKYFDRHGTPNERMRAHYILGRTYADMGEAPAALEAYLEAADCADTTQADCDYAKLSRVYAQSSRIYYDLIQPRSQIKELEMASYYAWKAKDTLIAIESYAQKANAYSLMHRPDSVVFIRENASHLYESAGQYRRAATTIGASITSALDLGDISRARHFIDKYECTSGLFDSLGTIVKGREMYYYIKGRYHLATFKVDSAEYQFRRLQKEGYTLNHQIAACKGLQEVYEKLKKPDSIAKYANLGYQLNDSAYSLSEMQNIQRLKASYNYNRNKLLAEQKTSEAGQLHTQLLFVIVIASIIVMSFLLYSKRLQKKMLIYQRDLEKLGRAQTELMQASSADEEKPQDTSGQQEEITKLQEIVSAHRSPLNEEHALINQNIKKSSVVMRLQDLLDENPPKVASRADMRELQDIINENVPLFFSTLNTSEHILSQGQYEICMLVRAFFSPSEIAKLMGRSDSYVATTRKRLLRDIYGIVGSPRELDAILLEIY